MTRFSLCRAALLFVVATGGCVETSAPVGIVEIPLTATGADGAIYRFPPGSRLGLSNGSFGGVYSLEGDGPLITVQVPAGDYAVALADFAGDTTVWPLIRETPDGATTTVPATLDVLPAITVAENQTTSLVIRFHIATVGPIAFSVGTVAVSVVVDQTATSSVVIHVVAPSLGPAGVSYGATTPAELPPRLPVQGRIGDSYALTARTVGAWSLIAPSVVCAPVAVSVAAGGSQGFIDLITEATPAQALRLCLQQGGPQQSFAFLFSSRSGAAITPLLSDLAAEQFSLFYSVQAFFAADVFDGSVLHLEALLGTRSALVAVSGDIDAQIATLPGGGTVTDRWYSFSESGSGTIGLTAQ